MDTRAGCNHCVPALLIRAASGNQPEEYAESVTNDDNNGGVYYPDKPRLW